MFPHFRSAASMLDSDDESQHDQKPQEIIDDDFEEKHRKNLEAYRKRRRENLENKKKEEETTIKLVPDEISLEKVVPMKDNIILEKFTELIRMFNSAIKNTNMSDEAKEKLRKPYKKISEEITKQLNLVTNNNKKKCDNSNCSCSDCSQIKKRWTAKKMLLTIPYNSAPKQLVLDYYKNKYNLCKVAIAQEKHKEFNTKYNTDLHLHLYIEWTAKKDIKNPAYLNLDDSFEEFGNTKVDIETIKKRTKENVYSYLLKTDKMADSWGFNIHYDSYGKLKPKELWHKYATGEWSFRDIVKYDPSIAFGRDLKKLKEKIEGNFLWLDKDSGQTKKYNWL